MRLFVGLGNPGLDALHQRIEDRLGRARAGQQGEQPRGILRRQLGAAGSASVEMIQQLGTPPGVQALAAQRLQLHLAQERRARVRCPLHVKRDAQ